LILSLVGIVALLMLATYLAVRHRVTDAAIAHSMASEAGSHALPYWCRRDAAESWRCVIRDTSGPNGYRVNMEGYCWQARRLPGVAGGGGSLTMFPARLSACIGIEDQLRVGDRFSPFS
jgi:hypothetical protein